MGDTAGAPRGHLPAPSARGEPRQGLVRQKVPSPAAPTHFFVLALQDPSHSFPVQGEPSGSPLAHVPAASQRRAPHPSPHGSPTCGAGGHSPPLHERPPRQLAPKVQGSPGPGIFSQVPVVVSAPFIAHVYPKTSAQAVRSNATPPPNEHGAPSTGMRSTKHPPVLAPLRYRQPASVASSGNAQSEADVHVSPGFPEPAVA